MSLCVGRGEKVGGLRALRLADGNHVHLDSSVDLLCFGERWRSDATAGLPAFGLGPMPWCGRPLQARRGGSSKRFCSATHGRRSGPRCVAGPTVLLQTAL